MTVRREHTSRAPLAHANENIRQHRQGRTAEPAERTDPASGLSDAQVRQRLEMYGENALAEEKHGGLRLLLKHFWGPFPCMIEAAAILSVAVGHWLDFSVILALLLINAAVSFWQEYKASREIELLKNKLAPRARVRRGGQWREIDARKLVPGDIVRVEAGNIVPADLLLLGDGELNLDESTLTGESQPVGKGAGGEAYSGSVARRGTMTAQVVATGMDTYFGRTARLAQAQRPRSHLQRAVMRIAHFLIGVTLVLIAAVLVAAYLRGNPFAETVEFCLILTVAAIPVALPAVLAVTMAVGAEQLAKKKAIVSRLVAIEEMAGMDILFADKTGTLTQNRLTVGEPVPVASASARDILQMAALASRPDSQDTIDRAIFAALADGKALDGFHVTRFGDFDAVRKYADADVRRDDGSTFSVAKGAAQAILALAKADRTVSERIGGIVGKMGEHGYRALAVARRDDDAWTVLGVLPMSDPPREDSRQTITQARRLGLDIRMVTGDHLAIARQIAGQVGLGRDIAVAKDLFDPEGNVTDDKRLMAAEGYAEVFPEHKFNIVTAFQKQGHIVGMTGDGVNDAPALRRADVGIAVSGATDAARAAAGVVLTAAGLSVIVGALHQARLIFGRMQSYATFRIAETIRVLLFMTLSILIFDFYPVTAVMIVLLALLNDFPIMMIAYDHTEESPRPARWDMRHVLSVSSLLGILGVAASFLLFWYARQVAGLPVETLQTMIFLKLLVGGHLTIYITRRHGWFWSRPWPSWKLVAATEATQLAGTLAAVYGWLVPPIGWGYALIVWGYALLWFFINDAVKIAANRRLRRDAAVTPSPPV